MEPATAVLTRPETGAARWDRVLVLLALALALAPIWWTAWAALDGGYVPSGDDAVIGVRADDVLTTNSPTLGMPSGTGAWTGREAYHPGPSTFWAYAPFVEALGPAAGLMVGVAAIGTASVAGVAWAAHRRGGPTVTVFALLATAWAYWAVGGPSVLFAPLNAFVGLLPFWCFLFLSWAVASGDRAAIPWWLVAGSFTVQADLTFLMGVAAVTLAVVGPPLWRRRKGIRGLVQVQEGAAAGPAVAPRGRALVATQTTLAVVVALLVLGAGPFAVVLAGAAAALLPWARRRPRRIDVHPPEGRWDPVVRWSIAVLAVFWVVPLGRALFSGLENLRDLSAVVHVDLPTQGLAGAARGLRLLVSGPFRGTGQMAAGEFTRGWQPADVALALLLAVAVGAALADGARRRRRGLDPRPTAPLPPIGVAAAVAAVVAAAQVPLQDGYTHYFYFSMIATSVFLWLGAALTTLDRRGGLDRRALGDRPPAVVAGAVVGLLVAVAVTSGNLADAANRPVRETDYEAWHRDALPELADEVEASVPADRPYELVSSGGAHVRVALNGLWGQLADRGYDLRTRVVANYYGAEHSADVHDDAEGVLWLLPSDLAHPPADAVVVAEYLPEGHDAEAVEELAEDVAEHVRANGPLELSPSAEFQTGQVLYGHVPDICPVEREVPTQCRPGEDWYADPSRLLDAPPEVLLGAYRTRFVVSPALTPALQARLDEHRALPLTVWLGPAGPEAR